jgi:beta-glucosidase
MKTIFYPLKENVKSIAVIGPSADKVQFGDYTWTGDNKYGVTPLQGIRSLPEIVLP